MTKAFKCDSCGELSEGESPVVARIDLRAPLQDFSIPDDLRVERNTGVANRVRKLTGDDTRESDLFMELCENCARDLIPADEGEEEDETEDGGFAETVLESADGTERAESPEDGETATEAEDGDVA